MFAWDENDLNGDQEAAITEPGNVLLIACPGSGKTRALTYKIALELSRLKSTKKYVVAITYTNRAADEIKDRIELLGVATDQLWIGTIHAFCIEWILRPYHNYLEDLKYGFRIINQHDVEVILKDLCNKHNPTSKYAKKINPFHCTYYATPGGLKSDVDDDRVGLVTAVLGDYWSILKSNNQIDFEMVLHYSFELTSKLPFINENLGKIFSHVLIDEFQDTREIQYHLFAGIFKASRGSIQSFIVGDPNQAIFTSLGGYAITKNELDRITDSEFKEMTLTGNYRSSSIIINYFDHYKTYPNEVIARGTGKDYQSVISFNNTVVRDTLEDEIVRLIQYNIEQKNIQPNEICIVGPQWVHLASLTRRLMIRLPDYSFNGPGMAPFAKDIENFFYKLCRIVLTEPAPNMFVSRLRWSREILRELYNLGYDISGLDSKTLLRYCNSIVINENDGITYLRSFFSEFFAILNIDITQYATLNEHYQSFFNSSESRIAKLVAEGYEAISSIENFRKVFKQKDGITVSTIHGVKGAEFDTVIAFALLQGYVPHFNEDNPDDTANRLLYVICSRAKLNLHLISERGREIRYSNPPEDYVPTTMLANYDYRYDEC